MIPITQVATYASQVAKQPVTIVCSRSLGPDIQGQVWFDSDGTPQPVIYLRYGLCNALTHADQSGSVSSDTALAMLTATHEAEHIALASTDEARVEATALANRWQLVRLFRLPSWIARWVMDTEVVEDSLLPANYHAAVA